jgi:LysM repeat protein
MQAMAAIDPGIRSTERLETLLRQGIRIAVVAFYVTAVVVALLLVRPAFRDVAVAVVTPKPAPPQTDVIRKRESVATFAARHGLDLGELLALNPKVNSLSLPAGTKLRVG